MRRRLEGHGGKIRLGERRGIAKLRECLLERLPVCQAFIDVALEFHRNLLPHGGGRRQVCKYTVDVVRGGHEVLLWCPSRRAIASANVNHSVVSVTSS
jgi:hypothetical protein